jgi:ergothioneine biosynthesis protein EgtB
MLSRMTASDSATSDLANAETLLGRYTTIRHRTVSLTESLAIEDFQLQSMPEASPPKWHLAHTTWFFERFVLLPHAPWYKIFHPEFNYLFNSYYNSVGDRHPRSERGLLTRPRVDEVLDYRRHVDVAIQRWILESRDSDGFGDVALLELGLQHEQQHQELLITDLKHGFSRNPLFPRYCEAVAGNPPRGINLEWVAFSGGLVEIGHRGGGFCFDNELPRHRVYLHPYSLASRLVTVSEYMDFINDRGYHRPELWLSDGWTARTAQHWQAPLYWVRQGSEWQIYTLAGLRPLDLAEPVSHVSFYEADAYARWAGARLPTEFEWEHAAELQDPMQGHYADEGRFHPLAAVNPQPAAASSSGLFQLFGDCWEWTASPYLGYPGYRPTEGALGEYNGKFMCNQMVLRGGSCASPRGHLRASYRNFFSPEARWQFSGIRLAQDL